MRVLATIAIALTVVVSAGGLLLWASLGQGAPYAYHLCVDKAGNLRLLDPELQGNFATACKKNESHVAVASSQRVADVEEAVARVDAGQESLGALVVAVDGRLTSVDGLVTLAEQDIDDLQAGLASLADRVSALEASAPEPSPSPSPSPDLQAQVLGILGPTGVVLPLVDPEQPSSFVTVGAISAVFTWPEPTPPTALENGVPVVTFNGTDEEADTPDANYWSRDDASGEAFSTGAWINMVDATDNIILAKHNITDAVREWKFLLNSEDCVQLLLVDESNNNQAARRTDGAMTQGIWIHVVATYDGSGGASAADGINIYIDGVVPANSGSTGGSYSAMENTAAPVTLGFDGSTPGNLFDGKMAGGPLGPFFTQTELSADDISTLYEMGREALGL